MSRMVFKINTILSTWTFSAHHASCCLHGINSRVNECCAFLVVKGKDTSKILNKKVHICSNRFKSCILFALWIPFSVVLNNFKRTQNVKSAKCCKPCTVQFFPLFHIRQKSLGHHRIKIIWIFSFCKLSFFFCFLQHLG